ncbi:unnamed protein product [Hermetia illucens]|uniref:Uncharacterized protein n=1 Tax=Hermetia illucens TaxID=343691 RepID=A0A7R8YQZ6_HERIL|nr:unnamed protein product [Hermetia illucens]
MFKFRFFCIWRSESSPKEARDANGMLSLNVLFTLFSIKYFYFLCAVENVRPYNKQICDMWILYETQIFLDKLNVNRMMYEFRILLTIANMWNYIKRNLVLHERRYEGDSLQECQHAKYRKVE